MVEQVGFHGAVECEILSHRWWKQDPDSVLETVKARHATAC
jgi:hypothetical protein